MSPPLEKASSHMLCFDARINSPARSRHTAKAQVNSQIFQTLQQASQIKFPEKKNGLWMSLDAKKQPFFAKHGLEVACLPHAHGDVWCLQALQQGPKLGHRSHKWVKSYTGIALSAAKICCFSSMYIGIKLIDLITHISKVGLWILQFKIHQKDPKSKYTGPN